MDSSPVAVMLLLFGLSLLPVVFILTSSFIKISMVCMLTRESLGVQQIPPNMVIYGLSLILSFYVMGPVYNKSYAAISNDLNSNQAITAQVLYNDFNQSSVPIKAFLSKHSSHDEQVFFYKSLQHFWTKDMLVNVHMDDYIILIPAFVVEELNQGFEIGFLVYLPSIMIDIIVSNILMAMGMMMMSPVTISLPIKLLLFIAIGGWSRLLHVILGTY